MCFLCVCVCVCVCFLRLLECDSWHDVKSHGLRGVTSRRDTKGHCPWTVTSTAKPRTTLQRCLLSAVPPPCVYVHVRVLACVLFVCLCVCVYASSVC